MPIIPQQQLRAWKTRLKVHLLFLPRGRQTLEQSHIWHLYVANASVTEAKPYRGNEQEATSKQFLSLAAHIWAHAAVCAESSSQVWAGLTGTVYLHVTTMLYLT